MHVYIAETICQMFSYDTMFGSVRILGFQWFGDLYTQKAEA
jgi:hypothetical protein